MTVANEFWKRAAEDLGFPEVLETVAFFAPTARCAAALRQRSPLDRDVAETLQAQLAATLRLAQAGAGLPLRATPDSEAILERLQRKADLSAEEVRDLGLVAEQALLLSAHVKQHAALCPELVNALSCADSLKALLAKIRDALDENAQVLDSASTGLFNARRARAELQEKLREAANELVAEYRSALAGGYTAERNGRCVLPVRSDSAQAIDGSVLGTSGSGSTLYIEPRQLFALNNRVYQAQARVETEEALVLAQLSQLARAEQGALQHALQLVDLADSLGATARWAQQIDAIPVRFVAEPRLVLHQVRHPLLALRHAQRDKQSAAQTSGATPTSVVANDLRAEAATACIFSGPNAGGKTVALKCLGLSVLLAQCGLPVPCLDSSEIGWFDALLTSLGDQQSVSLSLSTFSAHVARLAVCLEHAAPGTLVLIDEITAGTDPDMGSALAVALVEELTRRGAAVGVTTHYDRLKRLGATGEPYMNAAAGFDFNRMRPTFSISYGTPGASAAFAVAERFGIVPAVVARAEALLPATEQTAQKLLEQIDAERGKLADERRALETARAEFTQERTQETAAAERRVQEQQRSLDRERNEVRSQSAELMREVLNARHLLEQARQQLKSDALTKQALESIERLVNDAAAPIALEGNVTRAFRPAVASPVVNPEAITPGMRVYLPHLKSEAEVLSKPEKNQLRVSVSGLKMTVPLAQVSLEKAPGAGAPKAAPAQNKSGKTGLKGGKHAQRRSLLDDATSSYQPVRTSSNVCDLRGVRVEAGLEQVDAFLDQMLRMQERAVFILHGHGTGAMREAVRSHLGSSRHVERFHAAAPDDGGDAITVVWFRD